MIGKHKLKVVRRKGRLMLRCKRCRLLCEPSMEQHIMATKCPGRTR